MARLRKQRLANLDRAAFLQRVSELCKESGLSVASRYIDQQQVELLGLFKCHGSRPAPHWWVLEVNSSFAIWVRQQRDQVIFVRRFPLEATEWSNWIGDKNPSPINLGDNQRQYAHYRQQARIRHEQT